MPTASVEALVTCDPAQVTPTIDFERDRLIALTKRGIGMPIAGALYWIAVAVLLRAFPMKSALVYSFIATGLVFPIGYAITRAMGGDLFAKSERFAPLGMLFNFSQFAFWPVIIVLFNVAPAWVPFAMAVLFGSHFMGYAWLYRSRGYFVLAVASVVVQSVAVLVAGGPIPAAVPVIAAAIYAVSVLLMWHE